MINQIIIVAIIVLLAVIVVFGIYFLVTGINSKRQNKKENIKFNTDNLVEEESLLNVMDEKKNIDFNVQKNESNNFINNEENVEIAVTDTVKENDPANPFGVDMTPHLKDASLNQNDFQEENNGNKFFT